MSNRAMTLVRKRTVEFSDLDAGTAMAIIAVPAANVACFGDAVLVVRVHTNETTVGGSTIVVEAYNTAPTDEDPETTFVETIAAATLTLLDATSTPAGTLLVSGVTAGFGPALQIRVTGNRVGAATVRAEISIELVARTGVAAPRRSLADTLVVGNATDGTDLIVSSTDEVRGVDGGSPTGVAVRGGDASTGNTAGASATVRGGAAAGSGTGGAVSVSGGAGGSSGDGGTATLEGGIPTAGAGGGATVRGRDGVGTNKNGGGVAITGGNATGSGTHGTVTAVTNGGTTTFRGDGGVQLPSSSGYRAPVDALTIGPTDRTIDLEATGLIFTASMPATWAGHRVLITVTTWSAGGSCLVPCTQGATSGTVTLNALMEGCIVVYSGSVWKLVGLLGGATFA